MNLLHGQTVGEDICLIHCICFLVLCMFTTEVKSLALTSGGGKLGAGGFDSALIGLRIGGLLNL